MDYRIKVILSKIENDLLQPLVIEDLARSVNLSVSRLQHLFKKEVHTGIIKYINNLRLQKARGLLETTCLHVKEIRSKVGVKTESHFVQIFKQEFGATPSNYRRNFLK